MTSAVNLGGLILAAGESSRMGKDKALLPWPPAQPGAAAPPGHTLLSAAILALRPHTWAVVVAGKNANRIAQTVETGGAFMVLNPAPERGQFSSLQVGLREVLARDCNAAMITPVDCPPLSAATLRLLCASFDDALSRGLWAVAPENSGKHGHPLLANRDIIDAFLAAPVTSNAREVLRAHAGRIEYVSVSESLVTTGLNTPEEYSALTSKSPPFR
jgi:molybdenum cofactor cytidylyltransferase